MATALTAITKIGAYPTLPVSANALDLTWTTGDVTGMTVAVSGSTKYLVLMRNTGVGARTVTIASVADSPFNRTGDITAYSIGAGEYAHFYFSATDGWKDGSNLITITPSHAEVEFMLISF